MFYGDVVCCGIDYKLLQFRQIICICVKGVNHAGISEEDIWRHE